MKVPDDSYQKISSENGTTIKSRNANKQSSKNLFRHGDDTLAQKTNIILKLAIPAIITSLVTKGQDVINVIFLGHYKGHTDELGDNDGSAFIAGIGLGNRCIQFMGLTLILGMNAALDTLVSQAAGAGNMELCGVYLNRGRFVMSVMFIPMMILSFNMESILIHLGQDPLASMYSQQYVLAYLPGLYFQCLQNCQLKFLNNLGYTKQPMISQSIAIAFHPLWCYIFMSKMDLGVIGIGIAGIITDLSVLLYNIAYSYHLKELRKALFWPDMRSFKDLSEYLRLGLPSAFMICLDNWAGSLVMFVAIYVSLEAQSAQVVLVSITQLLFMVGNGLDQSTCAIIGQQLGRNDPKKAWAYYNAFRIVGTGLILLTTALSWTFRKQIVNAFTDIESTRRQVLVAIWLQSLNTLADLYKGLMKGVVKALGIQHKAVYVNIVCHWMIYPCMIYTLVFGPRFKWGIEGLWTAKIILEWCLSSLYTLIVGTSDWEKIAQTAHDRVQRLNANSNNNIVDFNDGDEYLSINDLKDTEKNSDEVATEST